MSVMGVLDQIIAIPEKTAEQVRPGFEEHDREHLDRFADPSPDALVFTSAEGGPLRNGNFHTRVWRPALATTLRQDLTPHELRHTCATPLIAKGADPKAIQAQTRHSTISGTFDVHGHLFRGHLNTVLDRLDDDHRRVLDDLLHRRDL